jgi:serine/threonine protein kinase
MDTSIPISPIQYSAFKSELSKIVDESFVLERSPKKTRPERVVEDSLGWYSETSVEPIEKQNEIIFFPLAALENQSSKIHKILFIQPQILALFAYHEVNKEEELSIEHNISMASYLARSERILHYVALQSINIPNSPKFIFSKWCSEGNLSNYMSEQLSKSDSMNKIERRELLLLKIDLAKQITEGLSEIHKKGFIHGAFDPSHILIDGKNSPQVYISNFKKTIFDGMGMTVPVQSWDYSPPEAWPNNLDLCRATDLWGLGLTLLELMYGPQANFFKNAASVLTLEKLYETKKRICDTLSQDRYSFLVKQLLSSSPSGRPETSHVFVELCLFEQSM